MLKANFKLFARNSRLCRTPSLIDQHNVTHPMVKKQRPIPELPAEIIAEILKRLQVKYILRCMCVRKSWYYLIKTRTFIELHLKHQKVANHKYLFFQTVYSDALTVRYDDVQCEEYCRLKYLPGMPMHPFWYVTSHGLMCVSRMFNDYDPYDPNDNDTYDPSIYLWNPLIQKYKTLPDSRLSRYTIRERKWQALAFGFVPEVSDFVVVHVVKSFTDSLMIGVYSLNADPWKITSYNDVTISSISNFNDVVLVNGTAFWLGCNMESHDIVVCFDTKTDILRIISLPESVESELGDNFIYPSGDSIAYFTEVYEDDEYEQDQSEDDEYEDPFLEMWVLEHDLNHELSWVMKMRSKNMEGQLLGVRNNGEPVLSKKYNLISYNLDNHEAYDMADSWNRWAPLSYYDLQNNSDLPFIIVPFVENLVLLISD